MYEGLIVFEDMRNYMESRRMTLSELAEASGLDAPRLARIRSGETLPTAGTVARICAALGCPVSAICELRGIEYRDEYKYKYKDREFVPPEDALGLPSYQPLRDFVYEFYKEREDKKTLSDLFDTIPKDEVPERLRGKAPRQYAGGKRIPGLVPRVRADIKADRSVSMRVVYKICRKLRCSVDYVLTYR